MSSHLEHYFKLCDPQGSQFADKEAFKALCGRLEISSKEADVIFDNLDLDKDGRISFEDFSRGLSDYLGTSERNTRDDTDVVSEIVDGETYGTDDSNEGKLRWIAEEFQSTEKRHLVPYLENAVEDLLANVHALQEEKALLEKSWIRDKQEHERHLLRMEEEVDCQVKDAEEKLRMKAEADVEDERKSLQLKMDSEMDNLQIHLELFEKVISWLQNHPHEISDTRMKEVKEKLDDALHDNKQLRMSLLDTQTCNVLIKSKLLQYRTLYEEKCRELANEREKTQEVLHDHEHLAHQLSLLHDVNKRLQDTNDSLRSSDEKLFTSHVKLDSPPHRAKSGSILGDYFDTPFVRPRCGITENDEQDEMPLYPSLKNYSTNNHLRRTRSMDIVNLPSLKRNRCSEYRHEMQPIMSDPDSTRSTSKESQDQDEGFSSTPDSSMIARQDDAIAEVSTPVRRPSSFQPQEEESCQNRVYGVCGNTGNDNHYEQDDKKLKHSNSMGSLLEEDGDIPKKKISDIVKQLGIQGTIVRRKAPRYLDSPDSGIASPQFCGDVPVSITTACKVRVEPFTVRPKLVNTRQYSSFESNDSARICDEPTNERSYHNECSMVLESLGTSIEEDSEYLPDGPAEKTFNVIFVGDAGVGKSSFALRISKGVFTRHMSSTLGVDFLMRTFRVDGCNVEVQLWDTAGQERFRSITKSYFRKADGVMLLYDCTCERSFLNVRQWSEDVNTMASHRLPLMVVANKIDLREAMDVVGRKCVTAAEGRKVAMECDAAFAEASAKEGSNVITAFVKLIRSMSTHQDLKMSSSTVQLYEVKPKKTGCCSK